MKLTTKGFATWVGAMAIGVIGTFAQAAPVIGSFSFTGGFDSLDSFGEESGTATATISGLAPNHDYTLTFLVTNFLADDLEFGSFAAEVDGNAVPSGGDFLALSGTAQLVFIYTQGQNNDEPSGSVSDITLVCAGPSDPTAPNNCRGTNNAPEPGSLLLVGAALAAGAWVRRKKPA